MTYGLDSGLNLGTYFGNGYTGYSGSGSVYSPNGAKVASSSVINRISRDLANGYNQEIEIIQMYLNKGDVNKAAKAYNELLNDAKASTSDYGYSLTDKQIESTLNEAFRNATGSSFVTSVEEETHSPFTTGLIEGIPIVGLFAQGKSYDEAIAKAKGKYTSIGDKMKEWAGAALTNAGSYAAIGAAMGAPAAGVGAVPGAMIGGTIGLVVGTLKCLFK